MRAPLSPKWKRKDFWGKAKIVATCPELILFSVSFAVNWVGYPPVKYSWRKRHTCVTNAICHTITLICVIVTRQKKSDADDILRRLCVWSGVMHLDESRLNHMEFSPLDEDYSSRPSYLYPCPHRKPASLSTPFLTVIRSLMSRWTIATQKKWTQRNSGQINQNLHASRFD